jgi:hypothetical protein
MNDRPSRCVCGSAAENQYRVMNGSNRKLKPPMIELTLVIELMEFCETG